MDQRLERILPRVQKPARYTGGEYRQIIKDKAEVDLRLAFCFPDIYEIGMSNIGMRILYATMNRMPGVWCERVFAPWGDMEAEMRRAGIPLSMRSRAATPSANLTLWRSRSATRWRIPPCSICSTWPASRCAAPTGRN